MQSRGDQVRSYQFFQQRVISGLVARESDPAELPFRRLGWSAIGSLMVTVLVLAGFGIYGLVVGGGANSWREGDSIIQEKETGALYIYREGRLHPVENLASARLVLRQNASIARVGARSLQGEPRGATIGIPDAPASLPGGDRLLTGGWTLCSQLVDDGTGGRDTVSTLGIGRSATGGQAPGGAVLVGAAGGDDLYLVWNGFRFAIAEPTQVLPGLGTGAEVALTVAPAWLNALPLGDRIEVPGVPERGAESSALGSQQDPPVRQGQVVTAAGTPYLVRDETLLPLTPLQRDIVLNAEATVEAYPDGEPREVEVSLATAQLAGAPERTATSPPEQRPEFATLAADDLRDAVVCAQFAAGEFTPAIEPGGRLPGVAGAVDTPGQTADGALLADRVLVEGGYAALAQSVSAPGATGGQLHLVTDQGIQYPLSAVDVAGMLGYDPGAAVPVPGALLDRLPEGPTLDPDAAMLPVSTAG